MKQLFILSFFILSNILPSLAFSKVSWTKLQLPSVKTITKTKLKSKIQKDLKRNVPELLKHKYVVKITIKGGSGFSKTSETVFLIKNPPVFGAINAKSDRKKRSSIIITSYNNCKWDLDNNAHFCKAQGIANIGPINITNLFTNRHILIISKSKRKYRAKTILWFAYDTPDINLYYLPYKYMGHNNLGIDRIKSEFFKISKFIASPLPKDPVLSSKKSNLSMLDNKKSKVVIQTSPARKISDIIALPSQPQVTATKSEQPSNYRKISFSRNPPLINKTIIKDYLTSINPKDITNLSWIRLQITGLDKTQNNGIFNIKLPSTPTSTFVFAWTDVPNAYRSEIGDLQTCTITKTGGCPVKLNGTKWLNLSGVLQTDTIQIRSSPQKPKKSSFIIWLGFNSTVTNDFYYYSPQFKGKILAYKWNKFSKTTTKPFVSKRNQIKTKVISVYYSDFLNILTKAGIQPINSGLTGYKYVMNIKITPDLNNQLLNIIFPQKPTVILGRSIRTYNSKSREFFRVQVGNFRTCKPSGKTIKCPYYLHDLGWRNLSMISRNYRTFTAIFTQDGNQNIAKTEFWFAFINNPLKFKAYLKSFYNKTNNSKFQIKVYTIIKQAQYKHNDYPDF